MLKRHKNFRAIVTGVAGTNIEGILPKNRIKCVATTITDMVLNATGKRLRDLPITPDKLL